MSLIRRLKRIAGTASVAVGMAGRLAMLRALEDVPDPRSRAELLHRIAKRLLQVHDIEVEELGDRPSGPGLIVANHVSYLDPLVIMARHPALPVAKVEVRRWPLIGSLCERSGVQFVARSSSSSRAAVLQAMERALKGGASILNFPEGTTTQGIRVLPLKPAGFGVARSAQVPVIPVAIRWDSPDCSWTGDASFVPHYLGIAACERIRVRLHWGRPLAPASGCSDLELSRRAHEFLASSIHQEIRDAAAECA